MQCNGARVIDASLGGMRVSASDVMFVLYFQVSVRVREEEEVEMRGRNRGDANCNDSKRRFGSGVTKRINGHVIRAG